MNSAYEDLVSTDDVIQEQVLVKLETGKAKVSPRLIRTKLTREAYDHPTFGEGMTPATPEGSAMEMLWDWAQDNNHEDLMLWFFEDPENRLDQVLKKLGMTPSATTLVRGRSKGHPPAAQKVSYSEMLRAACTRGATHEELIELISRFPVKRPASTVRQFLRRHRESLTLTSDQRYLWGD